MYIKNSSLIIYFLQDALENRMYSRASILTLVQRLTLVKGIQDDLFNFMECNQKWNFVNYYIRTSSESSLNIEKASRATLSSNVLSALSIPVFSIKHLVKHCKNIQQYKQLNTKKCFNVKCFMILD